MSANPQPVNVHYPQYNYNSGVNVPVYPNPPLYNSQLKRSWAAIQQNQPQIVPYYAPHPGMNLSNPGVPLNRSIPSMAYGPQYHLEII